MGIPRSTLRFGYALGADDGGFAFMAGIFVHRAEELARSHALRVDVSTSFIPVVLGHLIAHDIGHLLLGTGNHTSKGIMKARWRREELEDTAQGRLGFTTEQAERMRVQVFDRSAVANAGRVALNWQDN